MYTLQGKTLSTRHTLSMLDSSMLPDHTSPVVHVGNLSLVPTRTKNPLDPEEVLAIEDRLARPPPSVTSFPFPHDSLGVGERGFDQVITQLHQLTGPTTPACNQYIQYLLTGANPSVLNRHRRRLQPWRCWLSTHYSLTFPTDDPPLST
jgi:hypothetical protein